MYGNLFMKLLIREAKKNVLFLMAGPLRPNPPPPLHIAQWPLFCNAGKKGFKKKVIFFLMARPFTPTPLNGPAINGRT